MESLVWLGAPDHLLRLRIDGGKRGTSDIHHSIRAENGTKTSPINTLDNLPRRHFRRLETLLNSLTSCRVLNHKPDHLAFCSLASPQTIIAGAAERFRPFRLGNYP